MKLILNKKPKGAKIIEGFPGFGLIGPIVTEYLVDNLDVEKIGVIQVDEAPAMVAVHGGKIMEPVTLYHSKKYNLIILHAINFPPGLEWQMAEKIKEIYKLLQVKEIITLEGIGSTVPSENHPIFYITDNKPSEKRLKKIGKRLNEGIVVGVTGALLATREKENLSALFIETHIKMPDSKAAAEIILALDRYMDLDVDPNPLRKQAEEFERKLRKIFEQAHSSQEIQEKKKLSYVG